MASCSNRHKKVDPEKGHGYCSKPMWSGYGMPAGFCEEPAWGEQVASRSVPHRLRVYVPFLACPAHGGPAKPEEKGPDPPK